jgi:hypothetical protein
MRFSWDNLVRAMSLGISEAGIRSLRSRVQEYVGQNSNLFTRLIGSLCDCELEKIEKDLRRELRRSLREVLT